MLRIIQIEDPLRGLDFCLKELADFSQTYTDRRAFLLVPEEAKADTERRYMEVFDRRGLMMAEVLSFRRLAHRLASEAGVLNTSRLAKNAKSLLVTRILQEDKETYPFLGRLAGKADYALEIVSVLGEFDRYEISPQALAQAAEEKIPELSKQKIRDLARLQQALIDKKAELGVYDSDEDLTKLINLLESAETYPRLNFLKDSQIWIAGFGSMRAFTAQENSVILSLAKRTQGVNLALTIPSELAGENAMRAGRFAISSLEALEAKAAYLYRYEGGLEIRKERPLSRQVDEPVEPAPTSGQVSFEDLINSKQDPPIPVDRPAYQVSDSDSYLETRTIELWTSANSREEIAAVAGEIKRLLKSGQYQRRDIGVAICDENDLDRLSRTFREFGIDDFIAEARPLEESPLIRYLQYFFKLAEPFAKIEDLFSLAKTNIAFACEACDAFENYILKTPARYIYELDLDKTYLYEKNTDWFRQMYATHFAPHIEASRQIAKLPTAGAKARSLASWLLEGDGTTTVNPAQSLEDLIFHLSQDESERALLLAQSWEMLISLLEEIHEYLGDEDLTNQEFEQIILSGLLGQGPQGIPLGLDRVRVARPQQMLLYPSKVLFIIGATSATFPPGAPNEGLLQNKERELIEASSNKTLPNHRRDTVKAGVSLTHYLLRRGSERLYLSCPSTDEEYLSNTQAELAGSKSYVERVFENKDRPDQRWLSPERGRRYLITSEDSDFRSSEQYQLWKEALALEDSPLGQDPLSQVTPHIVLPSDLSLTELDKNQTLSVSRLETYNDCPYQYFVTYNLGLKERELFQPQVQDHGTFLHAMMELAMQDLMDRLTLAKSPEEKSLALNEWKSQLGFSYTSNLYQRMSEDSLFYRYHEPRIKGANGLYLFKSVAEVLNFNSQEFSPNSYLPKRLEWQFPDSEGAKALSLVNAGRHYTLRGMVDRIDMDSQGRVRLIDYKSSNFQLGARDLLSGKQLQLPLYAKAWQEAYPQFQVEEMTLQGLIMKGREVLLHQGDKLDETVWEEPIKDETFPIKTLSNYAEAYSQKLLGYISKGIISPRPLALAKPKPENLPCHYCKYKAICHFDERLASDRARQIEIPLRSGKDGFINTLKPFIEAFEADGTLAPDFDIKKQKQAPKEDK